MKHNQMKLKDNMHFWFVLFLFLAMAIIVVSCSFFIISFNKPYIGVTLSMNNQNWSIQSVSINGIAHEAGVRAGDQPVLINGQPAMVFLEKYNEH